jgi:hypothetical protein
MNDRLGKTEADKKDNEHSQCEQQQLLQLDPSLLFFHGSGKPVHSRPRLPAKTMTIEDVNKQRSRCEQDSAYHKRRMQEKHS